MERESVTVRAVHDVGPNSIALEVETPASFDAQPGQFVKLVTSVADEEESRFYTISSANVDETFELTIEIDPDGAVSPQLESLTQGDEVTLSGPYGNAYYEGESQVLVIAGGPGIGPAVGIAERTLDDGGSAAIVYQDDDPIHRDRLESLEEAGVDVTILGPADSLSASLAQTWVLDAQVFVYGFADFLDTAMEAIVAAGGEPDTAKIENFG